MRAAAIVVNFNGGADLPGCLAALAAQTVPLDVVLVDCASSDGSRAVAEHPPAGVRGLPLPDNRGYAGGCNAGLAALGPAAEAVAFFNPDCHPAPAFVAACLAALDRDPGVGGVAGRLERPDGIHLDSCGQVLTRWLLQVRDRGYGREAPGAFPAPDRVLSACGAGMVYRRAALEAVRVDGEVFPGEFFAFWEDLDLGWRVGNRGWKVVYEPRAVAIHRRGATAAAGRGRLIFRRPAAQAGDIVVNRWATLLRNLHGRDLALRAPVLLPAELAMLGYVLARRPAAAPAVWARLPRVGRALAQRRRLPRRRLGELQ
ncbi:MAG TPA: glycosyltransferase family 2 protein [Thermoanaerobaculaceae bacterium]|nr:glycosyltransferase family 2 protein [Thermoanaerobaculaceae bacterium]